MSKITCLEEDEVLTVIHKSSGCFHQSHKKFIFTKGGCVLGSDEKTGKDLGKTILSEEDLLNISTMLEDLKVPQGMCTTQDHVTVELSKDNLIIQTDSYSDPSGGIRFHDGVISLNVLANRLQ